MKHLFILLLILACTPVMAQRIESGTCDEYFKITDKLRKGDSLDRDTWHNFLQDKAIQVYLNDQGADERWYENYRKTMQVVYMPQKDAILQKCLKDSMNYWFIYLVYQVKKNEPAMKAYLQRLNANPQAYFDSCYKYSYTALPKSAQRKVPEEVFTIMPIHNDAHVENTWVVYSLICAYFNDLNKPGVLGGHELHHVLRPHMDIKPEDKDAGIVSLLQRSLNEGSADMVDKKYMVESAKALLFYQAGTFTDYYDQGKAVMPQIDSLLQISAKLGTVFTIRQFLKGAETLSGHVPGMYMSYFIEQNGLKKDLLQHLNDPFYFYLTYNKAAKKDRLHKAYVFSDTSIKYLEQLRGKYAH